MHVSLCSAQLVVQQVVIRLDGMEGNVTGRCSNLDEEKIKSPTATIGAYHKNKVDGGKNEHEGDLASI